jgi:hypothetical protein
MPGVIVFPNLASAIRAGYQVHDKTQTGYVVRIKTARGWAQALVEVRHT